MVPSNLARQGKESTLLGLKYRVYIALLSQIDYDNFPKPINATISTNVLSAGNFFKFLDVKVEDLIPNVTPGENPATQKLVLKAVIEGISIATQNWLYNYQGERVVVVFERCSDGQKFIGGSPCSNGLLVKLENMGKVTGNIGGIAISFEGNEVPLAMPFYNGPIALEDPDTISLGAGTTFALTAKSEYLLTDNSGAKALTNITGVTDGDIGRVIELQGAGVNYPTSIAASAPFYLSNSIPFSAKVGNKISFIIGKDSGVYTFKEVAR